MNFKTNIVEITADNITEHPQAICFINPKHEFYHKKIDWLKEQFENGLRIKLLYLKGEKKPIGFIEYVAGAQLRQKDICLSIVFGRMAKNINIKD